MARPEKEYQAKLVAIAHTLGYLVASFYAVQTDFGWVTPVGVDGKGWPDLLLCRVGSPPVAIEVKSRRAAIRPEQVEWLRTMAGTGYMRAWIVREGVDDLDVIARWLARPDDPDIPSLHGVPRA